MQNPSKAFCKCGHELLQDEKSELLEVTELIQIKCSSCGSYSLWDLDAPVPLLITIKKQMKTCTVYRTKAKELKSDFEQGNYNDSGVPQFEACVFSDGRTAQRWLTPTGSMVWWDSWENLCKVHIYAHPDYGTRVEWSDGKIEEL